MIDLPGGRQLQNDVVGHCAQSRNAEQAKERRYVAEHSSHKSRVSVAPTPDCVMSRAYVSEGWSPR